MTGTYALQSVDASLLLVTPSGDLTPSAVVREPGCRARWVTAGVLRLRRSNESRCVILSPRRLRRQGYDVRLA